MSTATATAVSREERVSSRLRAVLLGALFAVILVIPKILRIRQNPTSWVAFRIILGFSGAALVVLPLSFWDNWLVAPFGLCMFLASILLPPAPAHLSVDEKAAELGALVVVNGGEYQAEGKSPEAVRLFVGAGSICALDARLEPLLVVPSAEVSLAKVMERDGCWILQLLWSDHSSEFSYQGFFAEHLARVAQTTMASVMPTPLPVLQKSRGAGA